VKEKMQTINEKQTTTWAKIYV